MSNMQRYSRYVRLTLQALMFLTPLHRIYYWLVVDKAVVYEAFRFGITEGYMTINTLSKTLGFAISVLPTIVIVGMYYYAMRVFKNYEKGEVFTHQNVSLYKRIGMLMFTLACVNFLCTTLMSVAISFQNMPGKRFVTMVLDESQFMPIAVGLIIIVISYVMEEALRLDEEKSLTI